MHDLWNEILTDMEIPNYLHPFTPLRAGDSYEQIRKRILYLKKIGIPSMNLLWCGEKEDESFTPFNSENYWIRIRWVAEICREQRMTFMMQDAAPFPTGLADGFLKREENLELNKLYLGERHLDVRGPIAEGAFLVSQLVGSVRCTDQDKGFGKARPFPGDKLYAVVAVRRRDGVMDMDTAVDLTEEVRDGLLIWNVPEGIWRVFVIFETKNDGGRKYYINLLDSDSVALNIRAIYEPHYEHLKGEAGKTWLGFFYDEAEIGNLWRYCIPVLPGATRNVEGESMALPWSRQMDKVWREKLGDKHRRVLPLLWNQDEDEYHRVRCLYMDMVSRLVRENFNGVMQKWCREHGLGYIGHTLEDENTHCSLATGPVHYFRMQAHQDAAGIDLIGGQLMPGKDFTQAWYGNPEGDGEFYHYGIAKLASSAAHIDPGKNGRSFCEVFAVYGAIAGSRLRKFVYDHLLVNGINEMIPAPPDIPGAEDEYSLRENTYVNRMCHLMHRTRAVIKVAVLYHAEAEWYQGRFQRFQTPGGELARHQISYDVIPADVFEDTEFYRTDLKEGLTINGNRYEALVIPACDAVSGSVAAFLETARRLDFPVFYCDYAPKVIAQTGEMLKAENVYGRVVPLCRIADELGGVIHRDISLQAYCPDIRYAHFTGQEGEVYFILNEGKSTEVEVRLPYSGQVYCAGQKDVQYGQLYGGEQKIEVYFIDVMRQKIIKMRPVYGEEGLSVNLFLDEWQSGLLYVGTGSLAMEEQPDEFKKAEMSMDEQPEYFRMTNLSVQQESDNIETEELKTVWSVTLQNGMAFQMEKLVNINGIDLVPDYVGKVTYETETDWERIPDSLYLGAVYEICTVYLNGNFVGTAQNTPYCFEIRDYAVQGKNNIRIEVQTGTARDTGRPDSAAFGRSMSADVYNSLEPGGLLGPVMLCYHLDQYRTER